MLSQVQEATDARVAAEKELADAQRQLSQLTAKLDESTRALSEATSGAEFETLREKFEMALDVIARAGVPLVTDREQAWLDFNGWRVNYDAPLRGLETLTVAPTPWWDRPMRSAWATDEPIAEEAAARGA